MADAKAYEIKLIAEELRNNSDVPIVYDAKGIAMDTSNFEEIAKRASSRLAYQEINKQENIECVVDNAYSELKGKDLESEENVDKDWMLRFINSVEDISNEDMQKIWGKLLAGEIIKPHTFALRTLDVLRNLSQDEAKLFQRMCGLILSNEFLYAEDDISDKYGVMYSDILKLDECGLINSSSFITIGMVINTEMKIIFRSDDYILVGKTKEGGVELSIPQFPLSEAGKAVYKIVNKESSKDYFFDVARLIKEKNKTIEFSVHAIKNIAGGQIHYSREDLLNV